MKRIIYSLSCLFSLITVCHSQIRYGGMQQLGVNFSQAGYNTAFIFVNGVRFGHFFTGVGADVQFKNKYDYGQNYFNTSALYVDGRYYMNKQKNFFCKLDAGVNFINEMFPQSPWISYNPKAGYYGSLGIGFKARIGKELFYSFDISYCMRQTRYEQTFNTYDYIRSFVAPQQYSEKVDFRRNSIMVSMGLEIF